MTASDPPTAKLKICLVGDFAVGKTSLVRRFVDDAFDARYLPTIGTKVTKKELALDRPDLGGRLRVVMTL